ncbi:lipopolysaccharide biosynthesis protein [Paenibacillus sp. S28]|uniref:lipopolysaccharide biosynthesis protein n=1 Tax=Paenibacillus sp. S28 TaxID=2767463 RepID=UPI00190D6AEE|nr:polysaccharide biosynthesis C-terminal domain-containing protein [Paenibacillus sp. S28]MBJ9991090.1 polysaccharide biosynthesis C-terminal domain-containing protein [Paenibacillus sp. S28]
MSTDSRKMLSSGFVYFASSLMTQLVNLLLIPLYTHHLSQEMYGQYDLILSMQMLLSLMIALGVHSGMIRFFNEFDDKEGLRNTALTFGLLWGGLCIAAAWGVSPWVSGLIFGQADTASQYIPYVVMISVFSCLNLIYSSYYSMQFKALRSSSIPFAVLILTLLFVLLLFIRLDMGVIGILRAQLLANALVLAVLFCVNIRRFRFMLRPEPLRRMLNYGTGLLLGDISAWVLGLSDRFLIKGYMNLSSVAVYSIGYKIGMLMNPVFINPFMSVFTAFKFRAYKEADGAEKIRGMFRMYNFLGWLCVLGLSLFANVAVQLVAPGNYEAAADVIPIISFSYFLSGSIAFYSLGLHIANKMRINYLITMLAAVLNVACNIVLIPWFGIYGSALATVISYAVTNIVFHHYGSKYYPLHLGVWFPYKYLIIYLPIYGIYRAYMPFVDAIWVEIALNTLLITGFIVLSMLFKFMTRKELMGDWRRFVRRRSETIIMEGVQSET